MDSVKAGLSAKVNSDGDVAPPRLKGILFDKDGTLIDFQRTWGPAIHHVIHQLARGDADKLRAQADCLHFDIAEKRFRATSPIIGGATAHYGAAWAASLGRDDFLALRLEIDTLAAAACLNSLTPIGDPAAILRTLREMGLKIGLATNDSQASARRHLVQLGVDPLMDFVAGYDSGHGPKPGPGMVEAFAAQIGALASEIALVGDTLHDLDCARAGGAVAVAVLSGIAGRDDLAPHADYVIDDIGALPALVAGWAATSR